MYKFRFIGRKLLFLILPLSVLLIFVSGCGGSPETENVGRNDTREFDSDTTIGDLVNILHLNAIPVEGIALVGGLEGTGSAQCPPQAKSYLRKYIMGKLESQSDIEGYITSKNTTPVRVKGLMPTLKTGKAKFDLKVTALENTQTTSLNGGVLWGVDLYEKGNIGNALRLLASGEGPVYIDRLEQGKEINYLSGYVLSGGRSNQEYKVLLVLKRPSYQTAANIRNRLNTRFESDTAEAVSSGVVRITVPTYYKKQKKRFISIVRAIYMLDSERLNKRRISRYIRKLVVGSEKEKKQGEITLEAIGSPSEKKLKVLLNSSNPEVRLKTGRCLLNLGNQEGVSVLRTLALEKGSPYRKQALGALSKAADRQQIAYVARELISADEIRLRLAAYKVLSEIDDIYIDRQVVSNNVLLDRITQTDKKLIYAFRKQQPTIVIFGAPLVCKPGLFVETSDGKVTINASEDAERVTILRKVPNLPRQGPIRLTSSFRLGDIIQTLCNPLVAKKGIRKPGLSITYGQTLELLKKLAQSSAIDVKFIAGELPEFP